MRISGIFPFFRDLNFEKITKPVGNLISSLYKKGASYSPSLSTDTKLYKNPYVLTAVSALFLSVFVIRRFFPSNVSSSPEKADAVAPKPSNLENEFQTACADAEHFQAFAKTHLQNNPGWTVKENGTDISFRVNVSYYLKGMNNNIEMRGINNNIQVSIKLICYLSSKECSIFYNGDYSGSQGVDFPFYTNENICESTDVQAFVKALIVSGSYKYKDITYSLATV